jgi:hypothetical protein
MKSNRSVKTVPRNRRPSRAITRTQESLANPELLLNLCNQGIDLKDISIDVLNLKGCESKKLYSLGILKLDQLSNISESALRAIPHFGIMKVRRLKATLNSFHLALSTNVSPFPEIQPAAKNEEQPGVLTCGGDSLSSSTAEFISELEATSESLDKLKGRIRLYIAEIRKNQSQ